MLPEPSEFNDLIVSARAGIQPAIRQLYDAYTPHLLHVVRQYLNRRLYAKFDAFDFIQDAWTAFFFKVSVSLKFNNPQHLLSFLSTLTRNIVCKANRDFILVRKRDVRRETVLETASGVVARRGCLSPDPTQGLIEREEIEKCFGYAPAEIRAVVTAMLEGSTIREAAATRGCSVAILRQFLKVWL